VPYTRPASLDEAMQRLADGNRRFVEERPQSSVQSALRIELASGQNPFAVVLGCSDSRVPIETIFDQPPGNLFVVRVAGNIVNEDGLASIEYAIDVLGAMLVIVLGHSSCGAVQAATQHVESGTIFKGHIQGLVEQIAPAARWTRDEPGDWVDHAVHENVRLNTDALPARSQILREAAAHHAIRIAGAVYDLHSGRVDFENKTSLR
jgi:carbonic anhydrase